MGGGLVAVLGSIPRFSLPFSLDFSGHARVNDQDSPEDISDCVEAILRTHKGQREELPLFGITDPTFEHQPVALEPIIQAVLDQEPRASILINQAPSSFDQLVANLAVNVSKSERVSGG